MYICVYELALNVQLNESSQRLNSLTDDTSLIHIYLQGKDVFFQDHLEVSDPNHTDTYEDCHIVLPISQWNMYKFSELGFHGAHLLNMDEQYLCSCGTEYQVHETMAPWWSNNREADLSGPNLPPDLFLTLAFLQSSSLGDNLVVQLSSGFVSLHVFSQHGVFLPADSLL